MNRVQIKSRLIQNGHRLTSSRSQIVDALLVSGGHISADALYEQMKGAGKTVGRMTVFRTLDLLAQIGAIRPTYQQTGAAHYILLHDGHHHHIICTQCDQTIEFDDCILSDLGDQLSQRFDFDITGHLIELYGLCANCRI